MHVKLYLLDPGSSKLTTTVFLIRVLFIIVSRLDPDIFMHRTDVK